MKAGPRALCPAPRALYGRFLAKGTKMRPEDLILVSVDDHVVEPPTMFDQHLAAEHKAKAPRIVRKKDGSDVWVFNGEQLVNIGLNAVVGRPPEEYGMEPTSFEQLRPGTWNIH